MNMSSFLCVYNNTMPRSYDKFWVVDQKKRMEKSKNLFDLRDNIISKKDAEIKNEKVREQLGLGTCISIFKDGPFNKFLVLWEGHRTPQIHFTHEIEWLTQEEADGEEEEEEEEVEATPEETNTKTVKATGAEETLSNAQGDFDEEVELGEGDVAGGAQFDDDPVEQKGPAQTSDEKPPQ